MVHGAGHEKAGQEESTLSSAAQVLPPFLMAGVGMVGAGLLLDRVLEKEVFENIREMTILVPPLLGLKGNLEMTLASRLSSHAALGDLDKAADVRQLVGANLALIECQGVVLGFLASLVAGLVSVTVGPGLSLDEFFVLAASAMATAGLASFLIGLLMALVILGARKVGCNPDNVAAPVAAALGDIVTLYLLAHTAQAFWHVRGSGLAGGLVLGMLLLSAASALLVMRNEKTAPVLQNGWTPIVAALCISSLGGIVLDRAAEAFPRMPAFQPVMNGAGGNLAAVQASRMATSLHGRSQLGSRTEEERERGSRWPWSVFTGRSEHSLMARVLLALVVPGHLVFLWAICASKGYTIAELGHGFFALYLLGALVQEWFLLYVCKHLVDYLWRSGTDPDNAAVPFLTALGDLCGSSLLAGAFFLTSEPIAEVPAMTFSSNLIHSACGSLLHGVSVVVHQCTGQTSFALPAGGPGSARLCSPVSHTGAAAPFTLQPIPAAAAAFAAFKVLSMRQRPLARKSS